MTRLGKRHKGRTRGADAVAAQRDGLLGRCGGRRPGCGAGDRFPRRRGRCRFSDPLQIDLTHVAQMSTLRHWMQ